MLPPSIAGTTIYFAFSRPRLPLPRPAEAIPDVGITTVTRTVFLLVYVVMRPPGRVGRFAGFDVRYFFMGSVWFSGGFSWHSFLVNFGACMAHNVVMVLY